MRIRGKFLVFLLSCLVCLVYNTLIKIIFFHPTEYATPPTLVLRRLGKSESFEKNDDDLSLLERCSYNDINKCKNLIIQSMENEDINNNNISEHNISEKEHYEILDPAQIIPSENFIIESGSTPDNYVEVPKINGSYPNTEKPVKSKNKLPLMKRFPVNTLPKMNVLSPLQLVDRARASNNSDLIRFIEIQDTRKAHEKTYCSQSFDAENYDKLRQTGYQNIIIDREFAISFCPIYKAASTSWLANLLKLKGMWKPNHHNRKTQMLVNQVFHKVSNIAAPWMSKGTTRFMIVRHPFHRLISCYRDKYKNASKSYYYQLYGEKMVKLFRPRPSGATREEIRLMMNAVRRVMNSKSNISLPGNPYANPVGPTFEEFVKYIVAAKHDDDHWRPYFQQCSLCHVAYDFVLRFENVIQESKLFVEYMNMTKLIETGWENPTSEGSTNDKIVCRYLKQINSDLFMKLVMKYKHDFQLFNYNPDKFLKCVNDYRPTVT